MHHDQNQSSRSSSARALDNCNAALAAHYPGPLSWSLRRHGRSALHTGQESLQRQTLLPCEIFRFSPAASTPCLLSVSEPEHPDDAALRHIGLRAVELVEPRLHSLGIDTPS